MTYLLASGFTDLQSGIIMALVPTTHPDLADHPFQSTSLRDFWSNRLCFFLIFEQFYIYILTLLLSGGTPSSKPSPTGVCSHPLFKWLMSLSWVRWPWGYSAPWHTSTWFCVLVVSATDSTCQVYISLANWSQLGKMTKFFMCHTLLCTLESWGSRMPIWKDIQNKVSTDCTSIQVDWTCFPRYPKRWSASSLWQHWWWPPLGS
jgi:hypothetical protein